MYLFVCVRALVRVGLWRSLEKVCCCVYGYTTYDMNLDGMMDEVSFDISAVT